MRYPFNKEVNKAVAESARQVKHIILNEACCKAYPLEREANLGLTQSEVIYD